MPNRHVKSIERNILAQMALASKDPEIHKFGRMYNDAHKPMMAHELLPSQKFINANFGADTAGTGFKHAGKPVAQVGSQPGIKCLNLFVYDRYFRILNNK